VFSCSDDKSISAIKWTAAAAQRDGSHCSISQRYLGHTKAVNRLAVDGKRSCLWSVSRDLCIKQWKIDSSSSDGTGGLATDGVCMQSIPGAAELNLSSIALDEEGDGACVFVGSRDYSVKQYDVTSGRVVTTFSSPRNIVTSLTVGSAGASAGLVYQASEDLKIRVWDPRSSHTSKMPAGEITGFVYFALCMDLHPDGNMLAAGCKGFNGVGCEVKIFDLRAVGKGNQPLHSYRGHTQDVTSCKFLGRANSSNPLVTCCKDGSIRAWDVCRSPVASANGDNSADTEASIGLLETQRNYTSLSPLWDASSSTSTSDNQELSFVAGCFDGGVHLMSLKYDQTQGQATDTVSIGIKHATPPFASDDGDGGGSSDAAAQ